MSWYVRSITPVPGYRTRECDHIAAAQSRRSTSRASWRLARNEDYHMILRDRPFLRDGNAAVDHGEAFSFRLSGWRVSVARLALTLFVRHLYHPPTDGSARSAMGRSWFVVPFAPLALVTPLAWVVVFTAVASGYHIQWLDADGPFGLREHQRQNTIGAIQMRSLRTAFL